MPTLALAERARILFWIWASLWTFVLIWGVLIVRKLAHLTAGKHLVQTKTDDVALLLQFILWISLSLFLLLTW